MHGTDSLIRGQEKKRNPVEHGHNLVRLTEACNELAIQISAQSDQYLSENCLSNQRPRNGGNSAVTKHGQVLGSPIMNVFTKFELNPLGVLSQKPLDKSEARKQQEFDRAARPKVSQVWGVPLWNYLSSLRSIHWVVCPEMCRKHKCVRNGWTKGLTDKPTPKVPLNSQQLTSIEKKDPPNDSLIIR